LPERFISSAENKGSDTPGDAKVFGGIALTGANFRESDSGLLIPEIDDELRTTYEARQSGTILLGCGDKRSISTESAEYLREKGLFSGVEQPYLRYFGGAYGPARIALLTAAVQYGPAVLQRMGGDGFVDFTHRFGDRAAKITDVLVTQHSSLSHEMGEPTLNLALDAPVDCGYATNFGKVAHLSASTPIERLVWDEWQGMSGESTKDEEIATYRDAHRQFACQFASTPSASISRGDFARLGSPTMVLQEQQTAPEKKLAVVNFTVDQVSSPHKAQDIGRPYYGVDATQTAEVIMKSLPELHLDPEIILKNMALDSCATRAVLAGGDPNYLPLQRYGDLQTALDYLNAVKSH
jgi:hypothetical protein